MTRPAVDQLLYLLDEAFTGQEWHALLPNLRTVTPDAWNWLPPGGHRSIRAIVQHVGGCKFMYENHAFGDASLTWDHPLVVGEVNNGLASATAWLREGHERLRQDDQLGRAEGDAVDCDGDDPARPLPLWRDQSPTGAPRS